MIFAKCVHSLFRNNEFHLAQWIAFGSCFSRYMIETKPPFLNSAVADLAEGPLFRVKEIAEGRHASTPPFPSTCEHTSSAFIFASTVIKCVLRAASTLDITDGEQRALRKFSRRIYWVLRQVIRSWHRSTNLSSLQPSVPSVRYTRSTLKEIQGFLSNLTLWIRQGKRLKVTILSSVVTWKVFGYINILRKREQGGIYSSIWLANRLSEKDLTQRKVFTEEVSRI